MIDTVRYCEPRKYSYPHPLSQAIMAGGMFPAGFKVFCRGWDTFIVHHKGSDLRAKFCGNMLDYVEVSLSHILFGDNGHLLSCQRHIDAAFAEVDALLNRFSVMTSPRHRNFKRLDLVWHFQGSPQAFAAAHAHCRHPMIHRPAIDYGNGGLEWRGSTRITMYDKVLEQTKRPGNVIRLEVELRGKKLAQLLNSGIPVTSLDFRVCYGAYRRIVQMFRPVASPQCRDTLDLIAFTAQRYSIDLWPHWKTVYKNRQSANRARRRLLGLKLSYYKIDWATLLPNSRPRVRIDVAKGKVTKTLLLTICPPTGNKRSGMM